MKKVKNAKVSKTCRKRKNEKLITEAQMIDKLLDIHGGDNNTVVLKTAVDSVNVAVISIIGCDIMNFKDIDIINAFDSFANASMALKSLDHKYVFTDSKPILSKQKRHIEYRLSKNTNLKCRQILLREYEWLSNIEYNQNDRQTFLLVYGKNLSELDESVAQYINSMSAYCSTSRLNTDDALQFMRKLLHRGCELDEKRILPKKLSVLSNHYVINDKRYCSVITCHDFPSYFDDLTFAYLFTRLQGAEITRDSYMQSKKQTIDELDRSIQEIDSRSSITQERTDEINNSQDIAELSNIYNNVRSANERMMKSTLRIHLSADSEEELNKTINDAVLSLSELGIEAHINENEMLKEYESLVMINNNMLTALPLQDTYKRQYPFYYQSLIDDNGMYFGETYTHGLVILDPFLYDRKVRISYDMLLSGVKGSGKSATLKAMMQDTLALGHKVLAIDVEKEYYGIAKEFGGKVIKLSKNSIINPLELRRSMVLEIDNEGVTHTSPEEAIASNFASELSRINVFFTQYIPSMNDIELAELKDLLAETFDRFGINDKTDLSSLSPEDFPILSDLLQIVRERLYEKDGIHYKENITESKKTIYERIEAWIKPIAEGIYASMFNGHSTVKITDEKLIVFDVQALAELEENIYNAVLFQLLSMMWAETCDNAYNNKVIDKNYDRSYIVSLIDEAHRFMSSKNPECTDFIAKMTRRSRKYDAGLWFASQSITDFFPDGVSDGTDTIRTIFGLVQYKLIFKQPPEAINALIKAFPQFTQSELMSTGNFIPGEMLMSLGGKLKLRCQRYISPEDFDYFGNSRDKRFEDGDNYE